MTPRTSLHTIVALALVVTLVLPGIAVAVVIGSPDLSAHAADNRVVPGEDTALDVVVDNAGDLESGSASNPDLNSQVTTARGLTLELDDGGEPVSVHTGVRAVGTLPEGATDPLPFQVSVDEDAEPGTYELPLEADYDYTSTIAEGSGNRGQQSTSEDLDVRVRVVDEARFDIVDVSHDAQVGGEGDLELTIQNTGSENATDVSATVEARNDETTFGESAQSSRHVDTWEEGENRTLTYGLNTAASANSENYDFDLSIGFDDADGVQREDAGNAFGVTPASEQSFALENTTGDLSVGADGTLSAALVNEGDEAIENVVLEWTGEHDTISVTEREYAVGALEAGDRASATFDVEVSESARSGPRQFEFVARYSGTDGDERTSDTLEVREEVGPEADVFDLAVDNATVGAGDAGRLEVTVTNADDEPVSDVSAKLFADSPVSTSDDEAYVQSLDPGESETLVFGIGAAGTAIEKSYPVSLDLRYDEADGDTELSDTYRLPIDVVEPEGGGGLPIGPIVVVVLVALAIGGYYRYYR